MTNQMLNHMQNMETKRHNQYIEAETTRTNMRNEAIGRMNADANVLQAGVASHRQAAEEENFQKTRTETKRHNKKSEKETKRHNKAEEKISRSKVASDYAIGMGNVNAKLADVSAKKYGSELKYATDKEKNEIEKEKVHNTYKISKKQYALAKSLGYSELKIKGIAQKISKFNALTDRLKAKTNSKKVKNELKKINLDSALKLMENNTKKFDSFVRYFDSWNKHGEKGLDSVQSALKQFGKLGLLG